MNIEQIEDQVYSLQIAKYVLEMEKIYECSVKALGDGLNFMSDAYFVKVIGEEKELNLFAKVLVMVNVYH